MIEMFAGWCVGLVVGFCLCLAFGRDPLQRRRPQLHIYELCDEPEPDIPAPTMSRCDRRRWHLGKHSWELEGT